MVPQQQKAASTASFWQMTRVWGKGAVGSQQDGECQCTENKNSGENEIRGGNGS